MFCFICGMLIKQRGEIWEGGKREREHEGRKEIVREEEGHWGKERKTKENNCGMWLKCLVNMPYHNGTDNFVYK